MIRATLILFVALAWACSQSDPDPGTSPPGDGGPVDASPTPPNDLDVADAAAPDAAAPDAAAPDAAADAADAAAAEVGCNGAAHLCARRFDQVAYLTTHNAMANEDDGFRPPNQGPDMPTQLAEGVRALMLDTYAEDDASWLCHGYCALGQTLLVDGLRQVGAFLDAHPREVVSIIFEAYITPDETAAAFAEADLLDRLHVQDAAEPWPTLAEMIAADRRLVVFSDVSGGPAWHHHVWSFAWETHFSVEQVADFDCRPNRGDPGHALFILNHFITRPIALRSFAEEANPALGDHAQACLRETGALPNFVTVDFYRVAETRSVVDELNAADGPDP